MGLAEQHCVEKILSVEAAMLAVDGRR